MVRQQSDMSELRRAQAEQGVGRSGCADEEYHMGGGRLGAADRAFEDGLTGHAEKIEDKGENSAERQGGLEINFGGRMLWDGGGSEFLFDDKRAGNDDWLLIRLTIRDERRIISFNSTHRLHGAGGKNAKGLTSFYHLLHATL
jgi:hypothetical protein